MSAEASEGDNRQKDSDDGREPKVPDYELDASGGSAQIANFARFGPFPDSGPSCRVRRKLGVSATLVDAAQRANVRSLEDGQERGKIKASFAKRLWHKNFQRF